LTTPADCRNYEITATIAKS